MKKKIVTILMTAAIGTSLLAGQAVMAADTETATEAKADDTGDSKETEEEKEDAGTGSAPERLSGHDRARGGEVQHRPLHPRQPVSHGDGAEKLPAHDG